MPVRLRGSASLNRQCQIRPPGLCTTGYFDYDLSRCRGVSATTGGTESMPDVLKFIVGQTGQENDPQGRLMELPEWSQAVARGLAAEEEIELTDDHWEILHMLRQHYAQGGEYQARRLAELMEHQVADKGGRRYLYRLFPHGPATQACKIAGLPKPEGATDLGFGVAR